MEEQQLISNKNALMEQYIYEIGNYTDFIRWLKDRGENIQKLGFEDEEMEEEDEYN